MKNLNAEKCKDGWYVKITDTRYVSNKQDVLKLIRQEGLKIDESLKYQKERIFAN